LKSLILFLSFIYSERFTIEIHSPTFKPFPLYIISDVESQNISKGIIKNLSLYGFFEFKPEKSTDNGYIIELSENSKDKKLRFDFSPKNDKNEKITIEYKYDLKYINQITNDISNRVIKAFTGTMGAFGTKIAFTEGKIGDRNIFIIGVNGENKIMVSTKGKLAMSPYWFPDGKRIIFVSYILSEPDIFIIDMENGVQFPFIRRDGYEGNPCVSPDGKNVILSMSDNGKIDLFLLDIEGKIIKRLTDDPFIEVSPVFSPDGDKVLFVSDISGYPQLYLQEISSGKKWRFLPSQYYTARPRWSYTSNRFLYIKIIKNHSELYLYDANLNTEERLTDFEGGCESGDFSPDGTLVVASCRESKNYELFIIDIATKKTTKITDSNSDKRMPVWSLR